MIARASSAPARLRIVWADGTAWEETAYRVVSAAPALRRPVGKLVGGREVVSAYRDPVWSIVLEVGPMPREQSVLFRRRIGQTATVELQDDELGAAERPDAELWQRGPFTGELIDAKPKAVGADITRGDRWRLQWQALESAMVGQVAPQPPGMGGTSGLTVYARGVRLGTAGTVTEQDFADGLTATRTGNRVRITGAVLPAAASQADAETSGSAVPVLWSPARIAQAIAARVKSVTSLAWASVTGKPATATRWPTWGEVTSKPAEVTEAEAEAGEVEAVRQWTPKRVSQAIAALAPAATAQRSFAAIATGLNALTGAARLSYTALKDVPAAVTSLAWASVTGKPATATRWPTWGEVTSKPAEASQSEAEAGTGTSVRLWTPQRVSQAIAALAPAAPAQRTFAAIATGLNALTGAARLSYTALRDVPAAVTGVTNLSYTAAADKGTVASDTGTDADIPAADGTNAGLLLPAEKGRLIPAFGTGDSGATVRINAAGTAVEHSRRGRSLGITISASRTRYANTSTTADKALTDAEWLANGVITVNPSPTSTTETDPFVISIPGKFTGAFIGLVINGQGANANTVRIMTDARLSSGQRRYSGGSQATLGRGRYIVFIIGNTRLASFDSADLDARVEGLVESWALQSATDATQAAELVRLLETLTGTARLPYTAIDGTPAAVVLPAEVTEAEAEAGTVEDVRLWSPERVAQAIAALAPAGGGEVRTEQPLGDLVAPMTTARLGPLVQQTAAGNLIFGWIPDVVTGRPFFSPILSLADRTFGRIGQVLVGAPSVFEDEQPLSVRTIGGLVTLGVHGLPLFEDEQPLSARLFGGAGTVTTDVRPILTGGFAVPSRKTFGRIGRFRVGEPPVFSDEQPLDVRDLGMVGVVQIDTTPFFVYGVPDHRADFGMMGTMGSVTASMLSDFASDEQPLSGREFGTMGTVESVGAVLFVDRQPAVSRTTFGTVGTVSVASSIRFMI